MPAQPAPTTSTSKGESIAWTLSDARAPVAWEAACRAGATPHSADG
jgi:hypothetical protein